MICGFNPLIALIIFFCMTVRGFSDVLLGPPIQQIDNIVPVLSVCESKQSTNCIYFASYIMNMGMPEQGLFTITHKNLVCSNSPVLWLLMIIYIIGQEIVLCMLNMIHYNLSVLMVSLFEISQLLMVTSSLFILLIRLDSFRDVYGAAICK